MSDQPPVLLDLDGTLVDSVYTHVICWEQAFREHGYDVPMWRIHRAIGMGSDRLVPWLLGEDPSDSDSLSDSHTERFLERVGDLRPTNGALAFIEDLERRGVPFLIATSASAEEREALLEVVGRPDLPYTDSDEVASSKPAPHLLVAGAHQLRVEPAELTLVGDSPWDAEAAAKVGMRTIAVRTGGWGDEELARSGAAEVVDDPRALIGRL